MMSIFVLLSALYVGAIFTLYIVTSMRSHALAYKATHESAHGPVGSGFAAADSIVAMLGVFGVAVIGAACLLVSIVRHLYRTARAART